MAVVMPILEICGIIFEWHDPKYELILSKRKITFEEVVSVFSDDFAVEIEDVGDYNEQRMIVIGMSNQARLLAVVYTERANTVRIITAYFPSNEQVRGYNNARKRF
jgi:uncharacterized DUF497 family protein